MRQIFWIIMIVVVVIFGAAWWVHRSKTHAVNSGEVFVRGQPGDTVKTDAASPKTTQDADTGADEQSAAAAQSGTPAQAPTQSGAVTPPAGDTIPRNPPNGMIFAGKGKYQLYRQGDITWRLDTETGQTCVLFATHAEWRNPPVLQHGCGSN